MIASWSTLWLGDLPCRYGCAPELGRDHGELSAVLVANHGGFRLQLAVTTRR